MANSLVVLLSSLDPKALVALASPFITFLLQRLFSPSARLFHSFPHAFNYLINEPLKNAEGEIVSPDQLVRVASVQVFNAGRMPAKAVEIVFNWRPNYFNIWPARHYEEALHSDGRFSIKLDALAPNESFSIELLAVNRELPSVLNVRSEHVTSKVRSMTTRVDTPFWLTTILLVLVIFGLVSFVYALLSAIEFAVRA